MSRPGGRSAAAEAGRFLRANLSSVLATGVDWALVTALVLGHLHYLGAAAVGAAAGAVTDFSLKRHWAFDRKEKGQLQAEGLRYLAASGSSLGWNLAAAWALVGGLGASPVPGVIAASALVGVAWNYPVHRWWVFRDASAPPARSGP
jgi:putative flippase GtrA